jgi:polygalacturonase
MTNQEPSAQLSRRAWLGKVSVPALAVAGASMISAKMPEAAPKSEIYDVRDYGAKGDGTTLNTVAIQAAIDACATAQGGTVFIPAGVFMSGTIQLKSNVTFHLSAGGKLLGSPKRADYTDGKGVPSGNGNIVFLYAVNAIYRNPGFNSL